MQDAPSPLRLFDLSHRRALITGASQGIGFALAEGLGGAGATVVINGRDPRRLEAAADRLAAQEIKVETAAFDVTDTLAVDRGISAIEEEGPIDILINNAGIQRRAPLHEFTEAAWDQLLLANLTSVFYVAKRVVRKMIERRAGKIINICSVQSELGRQTIAPYTATKGAVKMLTKGMCADWARYDIQVNGLAPGYFETELNRALVDNEEFSAWLCNRTPTGRWGKLEELKGAAIFLAAPASSFVNGQILYVDGGLTSTV